MYPQSVELSNNRNNISKLAVMGTLTTVVVTTVVITTFIVVTW